jgi:hypothetical protein
MFIKLVYIIGLCYYVLEILLYIIIFYYSLSKLQ